MPANKNLINHWLTQLDNQEAVLVPTRSLANALQEQFAESHMAQGKTVWETPNILVWQDYCQLLWEYNKHLHPKSTKLLNDRQSLLLWQRVINSTRYRDQKYAMLNEQQTATMAQKSWQLVNDWQISDDSLQQEQDVDTQQFVLWTSAYNELLQKQNAIDETGLVCFLKDHYTSPFKKIIWYAVDLKTPVQQEFDEIAKSQGIDVVNLRGETQPSSEYSKYKTSEDELIACLQLAKKQIEANKEIKVALVIPDLQQRKQQVSELAKQVFYPELTPMAVASLNSAYRFSLGDKLDQWPMTSAALNLLHLLKNSFSNTQINSLFGNQYLACVRNYPLQCIRLQRAIKQRNKRYLNLEELHDVCLQCNESERSDLTGLLVELSSFFDRLDQRLQKNEHKTLPFAEWVEVFQQWLILCGWSAVEMDSAHYQLQERWVKLLQEFRDLGLVQSQVGLKRALEILRQLANSSVFLPRAPASPLVISGIYDAVGRDVDICLLTGMDENYPALNSYDTFIPNHILAELNHPQASAIDNYQLTEKVIDTLLRSSQNLQVSYSEFSNTKQEVPVSVSPLFIDKSFSESQSFQEKIEPVKLQSYEDVQGQAWQDKSPPRRGVQIIGEQSNCAFRSYAIHRLQSDRLVDDEFGLDAMQRGNIVHGLLEYVWQQLKTNKALPNQTQLTTRAVKWVDEFLHKQKQEYDSDSYALLLLEKTRLCGLLIEWLELEQQRNINFAVKEIEQRYKGEIGGLPYNFVIDRLDQVEDGRQLIIDYKTGHAERNDWIGERIKKPQLPLYAVTLEKHEDKKISGVAYAKVKRHECQLVGLSESGMLTDRTSHHVTKNAEEWSENRQSWQLKLETIASDFLSGEASVDPIEDSTCSYCEFHSFCRIAQIKTDAAL